MVAAPAVAVDDESELLQISEMASLAAALDAQSPKTVRAKAAQKKAPEPRALRQDAGIADVLKSSASVSASNHKVKSSRATLETEGGSSAKLSKAQMQRNAQMVSMVAEATAPVNTKRKALHEDTIARVEGFIKTGGTYNKRAPHFKGVPAPVVTSFSLLQTEDGEVQDSKPAGDEKEEIAVEDMSEEQLWEVIRGDLKDKRKKLVEMGYDPEAVQEEEEEVAAEEPVSAWDELDREGQSDAARQLRQEVSQNVPSSKSGDEDYERGYDEEELLLPEADELEDEDAHEGEEE